jgi:transposase-like protein
MITQSELKSFSDKRKQRAEQLLQIGKLESIDEFTYLVPSQSNPQKKYRVSHIDAYSCECEDYIRRCAGRNLYCKHIQAILLLQKVKIAVEVKEAPEMKDLEITIEKEVCPYCHCDKIIKRGMRQTKIGIKQRYSCSECKKKFVLEPISHIKGNAKLVCLAMDLYYKGNSLRDIADTFKQFYNIDLSHETIRTWVRKFAKVINNYSKHLQPETSGIWNADETLILTKRGGNDSMRNTGYDYVWNVMDNQTKFLLASKCSGRSRSSKDAQAVMKEAWEQNGKMPNQIITDRYAGYQDGIRKTFRNWGNERKVKHTSILGQRRVINNNAIENHHTHQKEFHKVRRGVKEVQDYQDGFKVFHNFVRKGVRDKMTPAERCNLKDAGQGNRWMNMLIKSVKAS